METNEFRNLIETVDGIVLNRQTDESIETSTKKSGEPLSRQLKDKKKETLVVKNGKVKVIDNKDLDSHVSDGWGLAEGIKPVISGAIACAKNNICRDVAVAAGKIGYDKLKSYKDLPEYTDNTKQIDFSSPSFSHSMKTAKSKLAKSRWNASEGKGASHLADKQESTEKEKRNSIIERFREIALSETHTYTDVENKDPHQKHKVTLGHRYRDWNELNSSPEHALTPGERDRLRRYHNTLKGAGLK